MKKSSLFPLVWFFLFLISFAILPGAGQTENIDPNIEKEKQKVLEKDREISKTSAMSGVLRAFYPFMTGKSILLPKVGHPVLGKETCADLMNRMEKDGRENRFKWEPLFVDISAAGDLAYTYGRYELPAAANKTGDNRKPGIAYGYYGTIWEKEAGGHWNVAFSQGLVSLKGLNQKPLEKQFDPEKVDHVTKEVLAIERAFSDYSVANGRPAAFYRYMDDKGIVLGSGGAPKTKEDYAQAIEKTSQQKLSGSGKLEWEALYSHVAASGDMAYNFGTYIYTPVNTEGNLQVGRGYFLTVWKKETTGARDWKFVFDCGNEVE